MSILEVNHLSIKNGEKMLVHNISFKICTGTITALVGKSGSGKTLTSLVLQGFTPPNLKSSAEILLDGVPLHKSPPNGRVFMSIMQNPRTAFNPLMSMQAHITEMLKADGSFSKNSIDEMKAAFADVELEAEVLKLYPHQMSGGMLQRAMIALMLLSRAKFIIADEPTTDLDLVVQAKILDLLKALVEKNALAMLLITHDFGVVAKIADEVYVIDQGVLAEKGSVQNLFAQPKSAAAKELIEAHLSFYKGADIPYGA